MILNYDANIAMLLPGLCQPTDNKSKTGICINLEHSQYFGNVPKCWEKLRTGSQQTGDGK